MSASEDIHDEPTAPSPWRSTATSDPGPRPRSSGASDVGRRRTNEDAWWADDVAGLYVVADGMGGYEGGEVASRIVVETLADRLGDRTSRAARAAAVDATALACLHVDAAIARAHQRICARRSGRLAQMGSTVAAVLLAGPHAVIAHVGDSRVYRCRGGRLERMTRDHTTLQRSRASGSGAAARATKTKRVLTRALGVRGQSEADGHVVSVARGDRFLLASDGAVEALSEQLLAETLWREPIRSVAAAVVARALAAGAKDNVTAVVVELV